MSQSSRIFTFGLGLLLSLPTALSPVGLTGLFTQTAPAQTAAPAASLDLIPAGDILGDGSTAVRLHFAGLSAEGKPKEDMSARVAFSDGTAGRLSNKGDGIYELEWTPKAVEAVTQVTMTMKIKVPGQSSFEQSWNLRVTPSMGETVVVSSNPPEIILGQDNSATLTIQLSGESHSTAQDSDLTILTSAGTVSNLTGLGDGKFTALYTPPAARHPHVAILTVADRRDPSRTYGAVAVPLFGKVDFPVTGLPNSKLLIEVGDRTFGPMQSDSSGKSKIPILVPPGRLDARVISVSGDKREAEPLNLMVPESRRVQLLPVHQSVPADPDAQVEVRAFVITPEGVPDNSARVQFTITSGELSATRHLGDGIYASDFTPPQGNRSAQATVSVTVLGADDSKQMDSQTINLVPIRPSQLTISTNPSVLGPKTRDFRVSARLTGPDGVGISGRELDFRVSGATVNGSTRDMGGGDYVANFSTTGDGPVELVATIKAPASGNPLRQILVFPASERVLNDGRSTTMVTVMTLDEFGYPVTGVPVALSVSHGDGSLPAMVTTDGSGIAQMRYTAGHKQGISHITASSGGVNGSAGLLQLAQSAIFDPELPSSGTAAATELRDTWGALVTPHRLEREGMVGAEVSTEDASESAGPITRLSIEADPAVVGPGGTVILRAKAIDATGRGASGRDLEFFVKPAGTMGPVTDLGGGDYEVTLNVEPDASGEIKVSVQAPETRVSAFISVPVAGTTAPEEATADPATDEPAATDATTEAVEEPKKEKPPRDRTPIEAPPVQVGVSYEGGWYSYQQTPATSNGPMYNKVITVGGNVTSPAGVAGLRVDASAPISDIDWLSVDGHFRAGWWSMEIGEGFDAPVVDALHDVAVAAKAQYAMPMSDSGIQLRPGLSAGVSINDFIVYQLVQEAGVPYIEYTQVLITGLRTSALLGVDVGKVQVDGSVSMDLNSALTGRSAHIVGKLGLTDTLSFTAHAGALLRTTDVWSTTNDGEKRRVGELQDGYSYMGAGVTWTP